MDFDSGMAGKNIWVGGTGRSGTTLLYKLLRDHDDVFAFKDEMRFIVDSYGLKDLVDNLTHNFSTGRSKEAWLDFKELMLVKLDSRYSSPYAGFQFSSVFGDEYRDIINDFLDGLTRGSYSGNDYQSRVSFVRNFVGMLGFALYRRGLISDRVKKTLVDIKNIEQPVVKCFPDRQEIIDRSGRLVERLFQIPASKSGSAVWCEKTPHNLLCADFLLELIPDSVFVHVYRDPRGVAQSFSKMAWASGDLVIACQMVKDLYMSWFSLRDRIDPKRILEVRLESFSSDPVNSFNEVLSFAGLKSVDQLNHPVSSSRVDYWKDDLKDEEIALMNKELAEVVEIMGYQI